MAILGKVSGFRGQGSGVMIRAPTLCNLMPATYTSLPGGRKKSGPESGPLEHDVTVIFSCGDAVLSAERCWREKSATDLV